MNTTAKHIATRQTLEVSNNERKLINFPCENETQKHKIPVQLTSGCATPPSIRFGAFRNDDDFDTRAERTRSAMESPADLALLSFSRAAEVWLEIHRESIKERTYNDYRFYIRTLNKKFGEMLLAQIHIGHILEYRKDRQEHAGAWCINHEIVTLKQVMQLAGLWDLIGKHYKPLRIENSGPPRVLTPEEEERFFRVIGNADSAGLVRGLLCHQRHKQYFGLWL